jgi:hypothetical protein
VMSGWGGEKDTNIEKSLAKTLYTDGEVCGAQEVASGKVWR